MTVNIIGLGLGYGENSRSRLITNEQSSTLRSIVDCFKVGTIPSPFLRIMLHVQIELKLDTNYGYVLEPGIEINVEIGLKNLEIMLKWHIMLKQIQNNHAFGC